mmetsp:Transcript_14086/g.17462  ORF Transcript_14086/g.17462 Transcript_14086/m.17462 type:complete len:297 (+) Transcript_14086:126-1016(+)|eukprot:CAMPEP_0204830328 /NCGR_PEP_ID=MMETSP1346-20131115/8467_1 /ASSEMBLY_ACC=CAM_ASM_000771 /TAXON_ID=215587 /ORGANISM="Aplanochytrium stocchinoi, Strain GSBS06" /LENGTH=296 /DNA_ID=CAMNT_0051960505 /DNA_START=119 /DNA_END=1009 /DNA_ORIENTATION=-
MEPDELYSLRNQFWLGQYKLAISEGLSMSPSSERLRIDRDVFVYRSHIALNNYSKVLSDIGENSPTDLLAVKLYATFLNNPGQKDMVLMTLNDWLGDEVSGGNNTLKLIAGQIYLQLGEIKEALKIIRSDATLEMLALKIQIYIKIQRVNLAEQELAKMQDRDDDSTLTQLATAWVYLALGESKYQEAAYIYKEQIDRSGPSTALLSGLASANIRMQKYEDAMKLLQKAIKNEGEWDNLPLTASVGDLLVNLLVCAEHLRKSSLVEECLTRLTKVITPSHPFYANLELLNISLPVA